MSTQSRINVNLDMDEVILTLDTILTFGKYKGSMVYKVIEEDLQYIKWALGEGIFKLDKDATLYYKSEIRDQAAKKNDVLRDTGSRLTKASRDLNKEHWKRHK